MKMTAVEFIPSTAFAEIWQVVQDGRTVLRHRETPVTVSLPAFGPSIGCLFTAY